jgi:hypothetical protein
MKIRVATGCIPLQLTAQLEGEITLGIPHLYTGVLKFFVSELQKEANRLI